MTIWNELTNECTCEVYDEETDTSTRANDCFGDCYEDAVSTFEETTGDMFDPKGYRYVYRLEYNSNDYSIYVAKSAKHFLQQLTNRISMYRIIWQLIDAQSDFLHLDKDTDEDGNEVNELGEPFDPLRMEKAIRLVIFHHDAPTGFPMTIFKRPYVG